MSYYSFCTILCEKLDKVRLQRRARYGCYWYSENKSEIILSPFTCFGDETYVQARRTRPDRYGPCGNKVPTRCNRGFYCRSYCLLNMFRASPCPSSGAQEYYTVVAACGILCCGFSSSWSGVELRVMRPVYRMLVERAKRSAIETSVACSWHFISTY